MRLLRLILWGSLITMLSACTKGETFPIPSNTYFRNWTNSEIQIKKYSSINKQLEYELFIAVHEQKFITSMVSLESKPLLAFSETDSVVIIKDGKFVYSVADRGTLPRKLYKKNSYEILLDNYINHDRLKYKAFFMEYVFEESDFVDAVTLKE